MLIGWDVGVGLYLMLAFWMLAHSTVADIHRQYLLQDEGGFAILVLTIVTAAASVGAVFAWIELATRAETFSMHGLALLFLTIALSWAFIHSIFALHYAHEYYAEHQRKGSGLIFPRDQSRTIGTSSISPSPSARPRRCPTSRSARSGSAGRYWRTASCRSSSM